MRTTTGPLRISDGKPGEKSGPCRVTGRQLAWPTKRRDTPDTTGTICTATLSRIRGRASIWSIEYRMQACRHLSDPTIFGEGVVKYSRTPSRRTAIICRVRFIGTQTGRMAINFEFIAATYATLSKWSNSSTNCFRNGKYFRLEVSAEPWSIQLSSIVLCSIEKMTMVRSLMYTCPPQKKRSIRVQVNLIARMFVFPVDYHAAHLVRDRHPYSPWC